MNNATLKCSRAAEETVAPAICGRHKQRDGEALDDKYFDIDYGEGGERRSCIFWTETGIEYFIKLL